MINKKSQTFFNVGTLFSFLLPSFIFFYTQNTKFANVFDVAIIIISIIMLCIFCVIKFDIKEDFDKKERKILNKIKIYNE